MTPPRDPDDFACWAAGIRESAAKAARELLACANLLADAGVSDAATWQELQACGDLDDVTRMDRLADARETYGADRDRRRDAIEDERADDWHGRAA